VAAGAECSRCLIAVTPPRCRFPTLEGPCDQVVSEVGARCDEHEGLDPVAGAQVMARAVRARRVAEQRRIQDLRRGDVAGETRAVTSMSDEQIAAIAELEKSVTTALGDLWTSIGSTMIKAPTRSFIRRRDPVPV
jgi:hypothetical protein